MSLVNMPPPSPFIPQDEVPVEERPDAALPRPCSERSQPSWRQTAHKAAYALVALAYATEASDLVSSLCAGGVVVLCAAGVYIAIQQIIHAERDAWE